jgi:hypothetical protein
MMEEANIIRDIQNKCCTLLFIVRAKRVSENCSAKVKSQKNGIERLLIKYIAPDKSGFFPEPPPKQNPQKNFHTLKFYGGSDFRGFIEKIKASYEWLIYFS